MPLQATSGAASYDAFGGGVPVSINYIEDVFSTYLYTGAGSTNQNIVNGIDLAGKGGLVWIKDRSVADTHLLFDTLRGVTRNLSTAQTGGQGTLSQSLTSFNSDGFTGRGDIGPTGNLMASWTFREQSKFFDIVTYTGNGVNNRAIAHSLTSAPGCIIVKRTSSSNDWRVYHRSMGSPAQNYFMSLNTTQAAFDTSVATMWPSAPTSTDFFVSDQSEVNASGSTYVAYLFAHNAGGFGLTGTDNVISCGSFTADGSGNASVNLGYEPQFWLYKPVGTGGWTIYDTMRGWSQTSIFNLNPNTSGAEGGGSTTAFYPTATGFDCVGGNLNPSAAYIYIAIRRGPMKVPTDATKVFLPTTYTGNNAATTGQFITTGFPVDMGFNRYNINGAGDWDAVDRLRGLTSIGYAYGSSKYLNPPSTAVENTGGYLFAATNTSVGTYGFSSSTTQLNYLFQRAPGFFDVVCYTGTGTAQNISHNLAAVPELIIIKSRSDVVNWAVYASTLGASQALILNAINAQFFTSTYWNNTTPTANVFTVGTASNVNFYPSYVAYLFATCPGVSKVGSYTGNGTTQAIACGFTGGARFVLIKRTDSTGDWYVYDTARGMTVLTDPYLLLNSTAAETATLGSVITSTGGFTVNAAILAAINTNAATYIFLAIA